LSLSPEPISLYDLMEDVILSNGPLARDKNLYMRLEADPNQDWTVMVDHVRMRQIFINLIGNSIKFTESGGITVELERLAAANEVESNRVRVRIRDTGIGIPTGKLEEIFEAFSQVDSSTTRKSGGTGLGLPISRRLVELHGGRLWAMSKGIPGEGAVFYMELPVGVTESAN
jgi:signal transduction histidine kinase